MILWSTAYQKVVNQAKAQHIYEALIKCITKHGTFWIAELRFESCKADDSVDVDNDQEQYGHPQKRLPCSVINKC